MKIDPNKLRRFAQDYIDAELDAVGRMGKAAAATFGYVAKADVARKLLKLIGEESRS